MGIFDLLSDVVSAVTSSSQTSSSVRTQSVLNKVDECDADDGNDPCAYCGHDPCWCPDDEKDERRLRRKGEL